jgi:ubiquinone/menaquinone biosynthesis C-methylase UbiE
MAHAWQSYDSAAATHDRVAVPSIFSPPARDLVVLMGRPAGSILDVGTGTGTAARAALEFSAPGAAVIGADPSLQMLRVARDRGLLSVVAGGVPGLPFAMHSFDAVLANFVLAHVTDYRAALGDMVRVLRSGGRLGVTAWAAMENPHRLFWQSIADSFAGKKAIEAAMRQALPWEDWFTDAAHLRQAFEEADLVSVELHYASYTTRMSIADFLDMRETALQTRFIRDTLPAPRWQEFKQTLSVEFYKRFKDPIEHTRDVHIAIGTAQ